MTRPADTRRFPTAKWLLVVLLTYAAAAILLTWPLSRHLADHLITGPDPSLNA